MKISLSPVASSMFSEVGHDADSQTLHIRFSNGKLYAYEGVTPEVFAEFQAAESKGVFFGKRIRAHYRGSQVEEQKPEATDVTD